jgi:DNA-binding transcriptional LysR family regulator
MIPSPADLTYFVEVAGTLNVSRAAERLGISQPSLSLALRRLETAVGAALLTRGKRGVALTQAGKQLLNHARSLLQSWDAVRAQALASAQEIQGAYTIGCHASVALYLMSSVLPALLEKYPQLDIRLRHDLSRRVAEDVISLKSDIGVVVNPVQHPDLVIHKLCDDEVTLWTAADRKGKSAVTDIAAGTAVLISDPDLLQSQALLKQLKKRGLEFARTLPSSSLEVIADLTANGCGIGILPARGAAMARKPLERVPRAPVFADEHCLIFRVENKNVKSIQVLSQAIRDFFAGGRERVPL